MRRRIALALAFGLGACAPSATKPSDPANPPAAADARAPLYGAPVPMRGLVSFGMEMVKVELCERAEGRCALREDGDLRRGCWLNFAPSIPSDMVRRLDNAGGNAVVFIGRLATRPGGFGHLNQYPCQVEAIRIVRVEDSMTIMEEDNRSAQLRNQVD